MISFHRALASLFVLGWGIGCGGISAPTDAPLDAAPPTYEARHTFPAIELEPGGEEQSLCQSWTLHNDEPLYVNAVTMDAEPGWHHSNWMFVPETSFVGPDGTWRCSERRFNELAAALADGAVFFAQSTQATHEEMRFPEGAAYRIPPHSRVIGTVHVINFGSSPLSSALTFEIETIEEAEVEDRLYPLAIDNRGISIGPRQSSTSVAECDFTTVAGALDWSIFYVLPHYHGLATGFRLELMGGARDGEMVFDTSAEVGDPLGATLSPPLDVAGASGLRLSCSYQNPGTGEVTYGPSALDEMCLVLAYTTSGLSLAGTAPSVTESSTLPDGSERLLSRCTTIGQRMD